MVNTDKKYNLRVLLDSLSSKASQNYSFYNDSSNTVVYGLYLCRGDVSNETCQSCVSYATQDITSKCPSNKIAIIWYEECMLRYSNLNFFGEQQTFSRFGILALMLRIMDEAIKTDMLFKADNQSVGNGSEKRYGLVQCTRDINSNACGICLDTLRKAAEGCCKSKQGWRLLAPSCNIRYENYSFFQQTPAAPLLPPPPINPIRAFNTLTGKGGKNATTIVIIVVSSIALVAAVLSILCQFHSSRKKRQAGRANSLPIKDRNIDTTDHDQNSGEMHYFDLSTMQTATNNFSYENKLGEGGFGAVFKGKLANGKEIAVKRLSMKSKQGLEEFKNEVMLIAKLQHRNLRTNIINGIARGLLYLHKDSLLKIIHRDLKASNILLDDEMNSKILDFGTARIFGGNQIEASTHRIVAKMCHNIFFNSGYMAPEYAVDGLFSIMSDVYSFGVLLLEIIYGKKNKKKNTQQAWQLRNEGKELELIDDTLVHNCPASEAGRFIHIALLCVQEYPNDRPNMSLVVLMLGSESINLPQPAAPPFSVVRFTMSDQSSTIESGIGFPTSDQSSTIEARIGFATSDQSSTGASR
ncbi:hypothetical protein ACB094_05G187200 [Castanea mollissima]